QKPRPGSENQLERRRRSGRDCRFHSRARQAEAMHRAPARRSRVKKLGIIAGGGDLPPAVAESVLDSGGQVFVVALRGMCTAWAEKYDHEWVSLGEPGRALKALSR